LVSSENKQISPLMHPSKILEKLLVVPRGKYPSDAHGIEGVRLLIRGSVACIIVCFIMKMWY